MKRVCLYLSLLVSILLSSCSLLVDGGDGSLYINLPQSRAKNSNNEVVYTVQLVDIDGLYVYKKTCTDYVKFDDLFPTKYTLTIKGEDADNYYSHTQIVDILPELEGILKVVLTVTPKTPSPKPDVDTVEIFDTSYSIEENPVVIKINVLPKERIPKGTKTISLGRVIKTPGFEECINGIMKTDYVTTQDLNAPYVGDSLVLEGKEYSYTLYYKDGNGKILAKSNPVIVKPNFTGLDMFFSLPDRTIDYIPETNTTIWTGMPNTFPGDIHIYSVVYENIATKERIEGTFKHKEGTNINSVGWNDYPNVKDGRYKLICFKDTSNMKTYNADFNMHVFTKEIQQILPDLVTEIDIKHIKK